MRTFSRLFAELDSTTATSRKVAAMAAYFRQAPAADAAWAVHFLAGGRPRRLVSTTRLRVWAAELAGLPLWLVEESYDAVGDLAETLALLLPGEGKGTNEPLHVWVEERLLRLRGLEEEEQQGRLLKAWQELDTAQIFLWNKLITGGFRVGVSKKLVVRALAEASGIEGAVLMHRLAGKWKPSAEAFRELLSEETSDAEPSRPYPFCLAYPLEGAPEDLGEVERWQMEWKWDGIRGQLIHRQGEVFLWSRGEELITDSFPEIRDAARGLPEGTVIDGEILAWKGRAPLGFGQLQRRLGRKRLGKKLLSEVPVALMAYDLLERSGADFRERPLADRRRQLTEILDGLDGEGSLFLSPTVRAGSWQEVAAARKNARAEKAEGLMLKELEAPYHVGRKKGGWWKWKIEPYSVDAVLIYAQRGHGRRASLYTDYTFGVWHEGELVPFAKAYSGLTDEEIRAVDRFVRRNTVERFGPVRSVERQLVFELHFEGIRLSKRHKSGIAVRFPRMARWRKDKKPEEADSLDTIKALLNQPNS